jgi:hypothetical protein
MPSGLVGLCESTTKCITGITLVALILGFCLSGLTLGIIDIIIGSKWQSCYLDDYKADTYLIVSGALLLAGIILYSNSKKDPDNENNESQGLAGLVSAAYLGVLIWGMTIVWDTEQLDCKKGQYDYLYYRTVVVMFIYVALLALLVLNALCLNGLAVAQS